MDPIAIVGIVIGLIFTAILFPICRSQRQSPWWSLLGLAGLIGFGVAMLVVYVWKPRKPDANLRERYASGSISEEEYLQAMTRTDRAA